MSMLAQADTPLVALDRALHVARRGGTSVVGPALAGGSVLGLTALSIFYLERVENVHSLRPAAAIALMFAYYVRCWLMSRAAHAATLRLHEDLAGRGARFSDVVRTAVVFGIALALWSIPFALASKIGWVVVVIGVPLLAFRGLFAPSWLARSGCVPEGGFRTALAALGDTGGRRLVSGLIELAVLLGALGLAANLFAVFYAASVLARTFLALDATFVQSFLAMDNTFLLALLGVVVFVVLEPLRAALSALAYVDARVREDGMDLRLAIDDAVEAADKRGGRRVGMAAAILCVIMLTSLSARAQDGPMSIDPSTQRSDAYDQDVRARAERILEGADFVEVDESETGFAELFARFLAWLFKRREEPAITRPTAVPLPPVPIFFVLAGVLVIGAIGLIVARVMTSGPKKALAKVDLAKETSPIDLAPAQHLDEASRLALQRDYRLALRALYLATLVALDRRRLITYDDAKTNWRYLRELRHADARKPFADFTRIFDRVWYGDEPATEADYASARLFAVQIAGEEPPA